MNIEIRCEIPESSSDFAVVVAALKEDPVPCWRIEGKHKIADDWILLTGAKSEENARMAFAEVKTFSGGFYRLKDPQGYVVDEHPEDSWSYPEKLKRLNITAPPDWNEYDTYLLNGGKLEYEDWKSR